MKRTSWKVITLACGVVACNQAGEPGAGSALLVTFDTAAVRIEAATDTFHLTVEVAETRQQRTHGLMERPSLPEDQGMLFVFSEMQDAESGFYMFRTLIPLDAAFMDADGRIVAMASMEPCEGPNPSLCRQYLSGAPFLTALEVNRGYFAQRGIGIGDRVVVIEDG